MTQLSLISYILRALIKEILETSKHVRRRWNPSWLTLRELITNQKISDLKAHSSNTPFSFLNGSMGGRTMCTFQYCGVMQSRDRVHVQRSCWRSISIISLKGDIFTALKSHTQGLLLMLHITPWLEEILCQSFRNSLEPGNWSYVFPVWSVYPTHNSTEEGSSYFSLHVSDYHCLFVRMGVRVCGILWYRLHSLSSLPIAMLE